MTPAPPGGPEGLSPSLAAAWAALRDRLANLDSLLVAFSGGVDSGLLLAAAARVLGPRVTAALCTGPFTPPWEAARARGMARELGVELLELDAGELAQPALAANLADRCYLCKRRRLELLVEEAQRRGIAAVAEGSQADDRAADRPGSRAVAELGVLSPLREAGLDKARVRALSQALDLPTAAAPAAACLATRIPTGTPLTAEALARVARAEAAAREVLGEVRLRVRDHFPLARLELDPELLALAVSPALRDRLKEGLVAAGYRWACLDLAGYHSGG
ncbi:MAG: ATP-dependent sacrificial sulfur transferase LarE [Deltaproteobacteria bacterium]|nr:ATP-dependent sacrificial sulfur transferase LarE [Deltaproteobacteria bacterium]